MPATDLPGVFKNQFHAAMAMLRMAIERCPDGLWDGGDFVNPTWRIIYHVLFGTHMYVMPTIDDFRPWKHHQTGLQDLDDYPAPPDIQDMIELPSRPPQTGEPYTKRQMLEYWKIVDGMLDGVIDSLDFTSPESGCPWYPISTLEFKLVALRHLQHHTAQIGSRIREASNGRNGVDWVGSGRKAKRAEFPQKAG